MKKTFFLLTLLTTLNAFATPIQWRVNALETAAKTFTAYHGETLEFAPEFVSGGNVITNLDLSIYWQTNGMDTVWWSAPGTSFTPAMDTGANDYRFFIRATAPAQPTDTSDNVIASTIGAKQSTEVIYRANGRIKLLPSPGFTPSELELPAKTIDFATIDIKNAPWATPAEIAAAVDAKIEPLATKTALAQLQAEVDGKAPFTHTHSGLKSGNLNVLIDDYATPDFPVLKFKGLPTYGEHWFYAPSDENGYQEFASREWVNKQLSQIDVTEVDPTVDGKLAPITTRLTAAENSVAAWSGFWSGDDFKVTVTNYPTALGANRSPSGFMPQLSMSWKDENDTEIKVWDESWWQEWLMGDYLPTNYFNKTEIAEELAQKADRAWGFYDSTTGNYAPEGYTQVSSPNIMLSSGYGFQRTLTTTGAAYWVLTGNYATGANTAAENGLFALYDCEGNAVIEAYKGDKQLVGADAEAVTVDGTTLVVNYAVESEEHPTLYLCDDLASHDWNAETEADCCANVTWSGTSGAWVVRATPKVASGKLFTYAMFYQGGESYIDIPYNVRRMKIGNTLYTLGTATISGNTVLTLTPVTE